MTVTDCVFCADSGVIDRPETHCSCHWLEWADGCLWCWKHAGEKLWRQRGPSNC